MRISDWSSDVCSSDLLGVEQAVLQVVVQAFAIEDGPGRSAGQYRRRGDTEGDVDTEQAARSLQRQRLTEQLVLQQQQGKEQEYRQKMQVGGDGVGHVQCPSECVVLGAPMLNTAPRRCRR